MSSRAQHTAGDRVACAVPLQPLSAPSQPKPVPCGLPNSQRPHRVMSGPKTATTNTAGARPKTLAHFPASPRPECPGMRATLVSAPRKLSLRACVWATTQSRPGRRAERALQTHPRTVQMRLTSAHACADVRTSDRRPRARAGGARTGSCKAGGGKPTQERAEAPSQGSFHGK